VTQTVQPLLEVIAVSKRFRRSPDLATRLAAKVTGAPDDEIVHAVDKVSLTVGRSEVVGLVGESGCGKSTLGRMIAGLLEPTEGRIVFDGVELGSRHEPRRRQGDLQIQMIFQDPFASLNPRMRIADIVGEAALAHGLVNRRNWSDLVDSLLVRVGLDPSCKRRYPHQFSGGQRQRIGVARALAVNPQFLICDEAVSALDVSIRAQVLNLFMDLRESLGLTYLFISHDLSVIEHLSDRVAIMYLGRIVELAPADEFFEHPNHPYSRALLEEVPRLEGRRAQYRPIAGEIPSPIDPPAGCHFHPRCPHAMSRCKVDVPELREIGVRHWSACHLNDP